MEESGKYIDISTAIQGAMNNKWKKISEQYFEWVVKKAFPRDPEDTSSFPTSIDDVTIELPEATKMLQQKNEDWLSFFRRLQGLRIGEVKLGRRSHKTRFEITYYRLDELFQLVNNKDFKNSTDILQKKIEKTYEPIKYSFPLRQNTIVEIAIPSDVSGQELDRLANFIKLLPHS